MSPEKKPSQSATLITRAYARTRRIAGRVLRALPEPKSAFEVELARPWARPQDVRTILDAGANDGIFATIARRTYPSARILSFEPLPRCLEALRKRFENDAAFEAFGCALGDESGVAQFFENEFSPSSSLLPMKDALVSAFPHAAKSHAMEVPIRRLDDIVAERTLEDDILLKMDVQGYEAHVIAGATKTLSRCRLVMTEVSLEPLYEGEALAHGMVGLMSDRGFRLASVIECLRDPSDERPLQMDMLFVRE